MISNLINKFKGYGGYIKYLDLTDFWKSLSENERELMRKWHNEALSKKLSTGSSAENMNEKLDTGTIDFKEEISPCSFLDGFAGKSLCKKEYILADKLINEALRRVTSLVDKHFLYNTLIENYYKLINDDSFLEKCIDICIKDIEMFPDMVKDYRKQQIAYMDRLNQMHKKHGLPEEPINEEECEWAFRIPAFEKLINIYEKQKEYDKAIDICKTAIQYGYSFEDEIEWLMKRQNKELKRKQTKEAKMDTNNLIEIKKIVENPPTHVE